MVGEALSWLTEQQIERGPFDAATASELLTDWASRRAQQADRITDESWSHNGVDNEAVT